jgi:hypothetical protein
MSYEIPKTIKISENLDKEMNAYCLKHHIKNTSEFIRYAITQTLTPDIEDPVLVFESLKQLHEKLHNIESQQDILFTFLCFYVRNSFAYHSEIPDTLKQSAGESAIQRYERFFKSFKDSLKDASSTFESLLADYFEERP